MKELRVRSPSGGKHGGYGWRPDTPDHRDRLFEPDQAALKKASQVTSIDLSTDPAMPSVWNQLRLGSCTAHSVGGTFAFAHARAGHATIMPARLWIYYQERVIEGTVSEDAGAEIRDGFKACATVGVPPEEDWPYDIATFANPPSQQAVTDAVLHKDVTYESVPQDLALIKSVLVGADGDGFPVSFGFSVYESFESPEVASTGIVPMPQRSEALLGGHAVIAVGFDDSKEAFKVRNSWGADWGLGGYCWMPYRYILSKSLASDLWMVSVAT